jgi:hypothetical protein
MRWVLIPALSSQRRKRRRMLRPWLVVVVVVVLVLFGHGYYSHGCDHQSNNGGHHQDHDHSNNDTAAGFGGGKVRRSRPLQIGDRYQQQQRSLHQADAFARIIATTNDTGVVTSSTTDVVNGDNNNTDNTTSIIIHECDFDDPPESQIRQEVLEMQTWQLLQAVFNEESSGSGSTSPPRYQIPTYFHIIQSSFFSTPVLDARVNEYMDYLQKAYGTNTVFQFVWVQTTRTVKAEWATNCRDPDVEYAYKSLLRQGGMESLNVYLCEKIPKPGTTNEFLAGYSYLPSSLAGVRDGVVLAETRFGDYTRPNTLVHEVVRSVQAYVRVCVCVCVCVQGTLLLSFV